MAYMYLFPATVLILFSISLTTGIVTAGDSPACVCNAANYNQVCTSSGTTGECRAKCYGIPIIVKGACPTQISFWAVRNAAANPDSPPERRLSIPKTTNSWANRLILAGVTTATTTPTTTTTTEPTTTTTTTTTTPATTTTTTATPTTTTTTKPASTEAVTYSVTLRPLRFGRKTLAPLDVLGAKSPDDST